MFNEMHPYQIKRIYQKHKLESIIDSEQFFVCLSFQILSVALFDLSLLQTGDPKCWLKKIEVIFLLSKQSKLVANI